MDLVLPPILNVTVLPTGTLSVGRREAEELAVGRAGADRDRDPLPLAAFVAAVLMAFASFFLSAAARWLCFFAVSPESSTTWTVPLMPGCTMQRTV